MLLVLSTNYAEQGLCNCLASVRLSAHPAAARRCCGFAAGCPAARSYRSIAARPAVSSRSRAAARRAEANAGSATLSTDLYPITAATLL